MNRDDIIRMAQEAGLDVHPRKEQVRIGVDSLLGIDSTGKVSLFAELVIENFLSKSGQYITNDATRNAAITAAVAAEREACAKLCDGMEHPITASAIRAGDGGAFMAPDKSKRRLPGIGELVKFTDPGDMPPAKIRGMMEMAAKAVGITGYEWSDDFRCLVKPAGFIAGPEFSDVVHTWNPRDDDGDSRRLQVALKMSLNIYKDEALGICGNFVIPVQQVPFGDDPEAAVRLAVLCAAAAIGEAMP